MPHAIPADLLALLVDPEKRGPLRVASEGQLDALREALKGGKARRRDGGEVPATLEGALLAQEGRVAYLVTDGLVDLVIDERIDLEEPIR